MKKRTVKYNHQKVKEESPSSNGVTKDTLNNHQYETVKDILNLITIKLDEKQNETIVVNNDRELE